MGDLRLVWALYSHLHDNKGMRENIGRFCTGFDGQISLLIDGRFKYMIHILLIGRLYFLKALVFLK